MRLKPPLGPRQSVAWLWAVYYTGTRHHRVVLKGREVLEGILRRQMMTMYHHSEITNALSQRMRL